MDEKSGVFQTTGIRMHLNHLRTEPNYQWGFQDHTHGLESLDWNNPKDVCQHFSPYVTTNMRQVSSLYEATYKQIAGEIDGGFLNQKIRSDELSGAFYIGFNPKNVVNFRVPSSEYDKNRINYIDSILFDDWEQIGSDPDLSFIERARMLLWVGNVRLHCTCPSFLYWGYQYICTVLDSAIYPEERYPRIRNPKERGIVCKHLNVTLRVLPFHSGEIAREIRSQFG